MAAPYLVRDSDWIRQAFLVPKANLEEREQQNRTLSSGSLKFSDTAPGGSRYINPPPQFTSNADIRSKPIGNLFTPKLGRYYSEAFEDNAQVIYMRFGVPQFNSLTTFFTTFYDSSAGQLARSGRGGGIFFQLGKAVSTVVLAVTWEFQLIKLAGNIYRFASGSPSSKFYYLKPTMLMYWDAVNTMVNRMAVNRGIIPGIYGPGDKTREIMNAKLAAELPGVFAANGGIDIYNIAGRFQRLDRKLVAAIEKKRLDLGDGSLSNAIHEVMKDPSLLEPSKTAHKTYADYLTSWFNSSAGSNSGGKLNSDTTLAEYNASNDSVDAKGSPATSTSGNSTESLPKPEEKASFMEQYLGSLDDGLEWVGFRVNSTGPVSESFSNTVGESELSSKINSMSSSARSTNFSFAGGNVADIPGLGALVGAVTDVVSGVASGLGMSGIAALAGSAFVDIPKHWQSHTASLPRSSYTINLVSPYGNPISQLLNLDLPLAMLLAAALPMATGKQSYTSPFLVELYDQGRCQTRLGMVDSLSITRGTGNLGFNNEKHAMAIDVTFSVVDLSSVIAMPIGEGFTTAGLHAGLGAGAFAGAAAGAVAGSKGGVVMTAVGAVAGAAIGATAGGAVGELVDVVSNTVKSLNNVFSDDTAFNDYMAVLAGMSLADQIYSTHKLKFNLTNVQRQWSSYYSASHFAAFAGNELPSRLMSIVFKGEQRN